MFEVVRVFGPGPQSIEGLVGFFIVLVEGVTSGVEKGDGIFEFCCTWLAGVI